MSNESNNYRTLDFSGKPINELLNFSFHHFKSLDGLRGIAVLIVMSYHLELFVAELHSVVKGGFLGVDIFFVLSGFLITSVLLKEFGKTGKINLKNFYVRRIFRLIPAYWIFLFILYYFSYYFLRKSDADIIYDNYNFPIAFFYLTNWSRVLSEKALTGNLNHVWSLSIEEQFYILWSLVLYLTLKKKRLKNLLLTITLGSITVIILGRALRTWMGISIDVLYYSTDTRIDALLIGSVASMIYAWNLIPKAFIKSIYFNILSFCALLIALSILFTYSYRDLSLYYIALPAFTCSIAIIIIWLITQTTSPILKILEFRPLRWVGKISYGLYLWHYLMYGFAIKLFPSNITVQILAGIILSFIVPTFSFYLIEQPFLKLKDKFQSW